ncbi:MAG TPA: division/cell wall cluster transcriptional repressor MraZ [Chitinophagaceae bacterium]|nr:division/cell wall cluster transcriptional repressor MraZ [Chitinophagaceae bacterium]
MPNYLGEFEATLDSKGRIIIPSGFKKQLPEVEGKRYVLCRGIDQYLLLYTESQWEIRLQEIALLNDSNEESAFLKRSLLNGATFVEPDSAGRIQLSKRMLEYANITKDIIFSAQITKQEIWDATTYDQHLQTQKEEVKALNAKILGNRHLISAAYGNTQANPTKENTHD